jgi:hypothetical protein
VYFIIVVSDVNIYTFTNTTAGMYREIFAANAAVYITFTLGLN